MTWSRRPARVPGGKDWATLESWEGPFAEIFRELEQPELLFLSLLFHDVGKGLTSGSHVQGSLGAIERVAAELALAPEERATVSFLIASHLEMSATLQRRDIFDPETIRAFAEKIESPERLKMLTLAHLCGHQGGEPGGADRRGKPRCSGGCLRPRSTTSSGILMTKGSRRWTPGRRRRLCPPRFRPTPLPSG